MADALKNARTLAKSAFTRSANALDEAIKQDAPSVSIQRKLERMQECFKEVENRNDEYQLSLTEPETDQEQWISEISMRFEQMEINADVLEEKRRIEAEKQSEAKKREEQEMRDELRREEERKRQDSNERTKQAGFKIEKLRIEQFDGNLREYPSFKSNFERFLKPNIRKEEEAFVLKSYLAKTVRQDVDMMEEPEQIWKRLDQKYGNRRKLVDTILHDIKQLKLCNDEQPSKTLIMIEVLEKAHRDLKILGMEQEICNATIISSIEEKLPAEIEKEWIKLATDIDESEQDREMFPELLNLLIGFKRRLEYKHSEIRNGMKTMKGSSNVTRTSNEETTTINASRNQCWIHLNEDHPIWRCEIFKKKSPKERADLAKENNACFKCLEVGHISRFCRRNFKCNQEGCGGRHHALLHGSYSSGSSMHTRSKDDVLLQLQIVHARKSDGDIEKTNVLWDAGSTLSFITFEKAKSLNLKGGKEVKLHIEKVGGNTEEMLSREFKIRFIDARGSDVELTLLGIDKISSEVSVVNERILSQMFPAVKGLERPNRGEIECLIGYDYADYHPVKESAMRHLLLLKNRFGYLVGGAHPSVKEDTRQLLIKGTVNRVQKISVESFYEIEQLGINCSPKCGSCKCGKCQPGGKDMTLQEEREYNQIKSGLHYNEAAEKWTAEYPWIRNPQKLPNNKPAAFGALKSCERRLKKDEVLAKQYQDQIEDMKRRGVCRKVSEEEIMNYGGPVHYLPHHEVIKPDSTSTPLRIVFNSSAQFRGHNMNEYLAKGPDMLNNLAGVLMRFRENYVAIAGDISKMFHSINIAHRDQMLHLFLWRDLKDKEQPDTYAIQVVNFGDKPSGAIALATLRETADKFKNEFPNASECVKENSYMDDILDSVDDTEEANKLTENITTLLRKGSFAIKEWSVSYNPNDRNSEQDMPEINERSEGKVLGMYWNTQGDELKFKCKLNFSERIRKLKTGPDILPNEILRNIPMLTKRKILSQVNGIYDPLGLLAPFIIKAKILLRRLWVEKEIGWDDSIPESHQREWENFFVESGGLSKIKFKRCVKPEGAVENPILIIFSDASQEAYGAVAYTRWMVDEGTFKTGLTFSKTRIAPIKIKDIVKLELTAAVISKRVRSFIEKESRYNFSEVIHIVDSEIVKAMISKESYGFNTYAANRIGEIQESTKPEEWVWLSGKENIADWCTRGKSIDDIGEGSIWQEGPEFMKQPRSEWPVSRNTNIEEIPEIKKIMAAVLIDATELTERIGTSKCSQIETDESAERQNETKGETEETKEEDERQKENVNDDIAEYQREEEGTRSEEVQENKMKTLKGECVNKQGKFEGGLRSDDHQELSESIRNVAEDLNKESESNIERISMRRISEHGSKGIGEERSDKEEVKLQGGRSPRKARGEDARKKEPRMVNTKMKETTYSSEDEVTDTGARSQKDCTERIIQRNNINTSKKADKQPRQENCQETEDKKAKRDGSDEILRKGEPDMEGRTADDDYSGSDAKFKDRNVSQDINRDTKNDINSKITVRDGGTMDLYLETNKRKKPEIYYTAVEKGEARSTGKGMVYNEEAAMEEISKDNLIQEIVRMYIGRDGESSMRNRSRSYQDETDANGNTEEIEELVSHVYSIQENTEISCGDDKLHVERIAEGEKRTTGIDDGYLSKDRECRTETSREVKDESQTLQDKEQKAGIAEKVDKGSKVENRSGNENSTTIEPEREWDTDLKEIGSKTMIIHHANRNESLASRIKLDRFSKIERLLGTTARLIWLYRKYKIPSEVRNVPAVTVDTLIAAERLWIMECQATLRASISEKSYTKLVPRIKDGIVLAGGRCERWNDATWNRQEFILLPNDHHFSYLIAEYEHRKGGHKGITSTISMIRRKFWIIKVRKLVGSIINKCVLCRRRLKVLSEQVMSSLPEERLKPSPPFYHTSLDYFGPFVIRGEVQKRTRGKAYGILFTCLATRAVHIDLSHDYSTDGFLQVLRRFACLRGWPRSFFSDKGSQLVGASKELKGVVSNLDESRIIRYNANQGTTWRFAAPNAKWMNGVTESLVKTVKKALESAIGEQVMEFSSLQTVLFEASEMVNSRPIGMMPASIDEGSYLAPNDMLLGRTTNAVPQEGFVINERIHRRYYFVQEVASSFWKKWVQLVFPNLVVRTKWHTEKRAVKVGDVVMVKDGEAMRSTWKLAKVVGTARSGDERVRRVMISYRNEGALTNTTVERHVRSLVVLLPVEEQ